MPAEHPDRVDYRALRKQVREQRHSRRTVRHPICLDAALYDEWSALKEVERRETVDGIGREPGQPDPTARAGDLPTSEKLRLVEERIAAASVVAIFVVPDPDVQAKRDAKWETIRAGDNTEAIAEHAVASSRASILEAFDHFEDADGNPIPAEQFGVEDLKELMADMTQGQLYGIAAEITRRSSEVPELPLSARRSLVPQP
jgi:hypothetical protein